MKRLLLLCSLLFLSFFVWSQDSFNELSSEPFRPDFYQAPSSDFEIPANPQNTRHWFGEEEWTFGIRLGVAGSKILDIRNTIISPIYPTDDYTVEIPHRWSFVGGIFGHYKFSTSRPIAFAFQPEINFAMQGSNFHYTDSLFNSMTNMKEPNLDYNIRFKYHYINFNVMSKIYFASGFHVMFGPQLEINITANNIDYTSNYNDVNAPILGIDEQIRDNLRQVLKGKTHLSFSTGLGYEYLFDNGFGMNIEGRYNFGITDLIHTSSNGFFMKENPSERSRSWQFTLGFIIPFER